MHIKVTPEEIIFLIPTCTKYSDKAKAIRNTWVNELSVLGFRYLFLMGKPELRQSEVENDILYVPCKDDYESLLLKLILGYEFLYQNIHFTYVYKIDDDCYPNLKKLVNEILPQLVNKKYIGGATHPGGGKMNDQWHFGKCSNPKFDKPYKYNVAPFEYAKGGYGYFLHKDILPILFALKSELTSELENYIYSYEDVRVADILKSHNILVDSLDNYSLVAGADYNNSEHYLVYDIQNPELMKLIEQQRLDVEELLPADSYLNHYFNKVYVVNLKHKVSNRLKVSLHLNKHGIDFEIFEAINGYTGEPLCKFNEYQKRELGNFKRYPEYSEKEKQRGHAYISSAGAVGYIYTYLSILEDAKKSGYKRFLILEDDILLSENFEKKFKNFIQTVDEDWKILLLGASQYSWDTVNVNTANEKGYYSPRSVDTCGSFAIALDSSVIDELIEAESAFEAPFDFLPIGELYERYLGKCFVAYPNIVIPDVEDSTIREGRCQHSHSEKMKWPLAKFNFPLNKPSISVLITNKDNLKYYPNFSYAKQLPFDLRLFFNSNDGLRPLHNTELLDTIKNEIQPLDDNIFVPESDYLVTIDEKEILTENDIIKFLEYKLNIQENNATPLKEIEAHRKKVQKGRVSVIIPTYKRPENLKNALTSVITQDYHDVEVIVVSDNEKDSRFKEETRQLVSSFYNQNTNCSIVLLEHTVNRNGAAARNTGIMHSTGEYICFLDDDDIYLQGRLSKSIAKLMKTDKNTAAVYCGYIGWNSQKNDLNRYKTGDLTLEILHLDYKKHYLCSNTGTYRRWAIVSINGFDESYRRHQDLEFNLRFFEQYKIEAVKECLVQLTPQTTDVNNKVYNLSMLELKQKFLNQFSYIIQTYDSELATSIYKAHWDEAKLFVADTDAFVSEVKENSKDGLIHILSHNKPIDPRISQKKYDALKNKYDSIMKLMFHLTEISVKTKPRQKILAYKSLIQSYHKFKVRK